eukprot:366462-Chlamydomonas_euryale.AAC.5
MKGGDGAGEEGREGMVARACVLSQSDNIYVRSTRGLIVFVSMASIVLPASVCCGCLLCELVSTSMCCGCVLRGLAPAMMGSFVVPAPVEFIVPAVVVPSACPATQLSLPSAAFVLQATNVVSKAVLGSQ